MVTALVAMPVERLASAFDGMWLRKDTRRGREEEEEEEEEKGEGRREEGGGRRKEQLEVKGIDEVVVRTAWMSCISVCSAHLSWSASALLCLIICSRRWLCSTCLALWCNAWR